MSAAVKITLFSCSYCGAVPRELAALRRISYPASVHVVEFPCLSRVQTDILLAAFEAGADGVLLVGCEEGNCHHQDGNKRTLKRLPAIQDLLAATGISKERVGLLLTGLGQPTRFASEVTAFVNSIVALGPLSAGESSGDQSTAKTTA